MIENSEHLADVFGSVLQYGAEDSDIFFQFSSVDAEQMFEDIWFNLYQIIIKYHRLTGKIISGDEYFKLIDDSQFSVEDKEKYKKLFLDLREREVKEDAFKFYIHRIKNKIVKDKSYVMLVNAHNALASELKVGKNTYRGYSGMKQFLAEKIYDIDRLTTENAPAGNANDETNEVLDEYESFKEKKNYIPTGFSAVDKCVGGLFPGELWLWSGYVGEGKTFSCINIGHHAAYVQKKNVLFLTSETVRSVVRRRLISRHAKQVTHKGIDLSDWKKGELNDESREILLKTLKDMRDKSNEYGVFYIIQLPSNATSDFVAAELTRCQAKFNIDLCILDSIHLLNPKRRRQSEHSELADIITEVKKLILSHDNGRGVPLLSPWHTNRSSWEKAKEENKYYTKSALAKTSEAEKCADVVVSILREDGCENELRGSIVKSRDGAELPEFFLRCDFSQGYVGDNLTAEVDLEDVLNFY